MNIKFFKTLKKTHWTQFSEISEWFSNLLIINILHETPSSLLSNVTKKTFIFKFLFSHFSKAKIIHFFTFWLKQTVFFFASLCFFSPQRAVFIFSAHSGKISSALQIKLQCAAEKKTVRWKFENLVLFLQELFTGDK